MRPVNWRAIYWVTRVLMAVLLVVGVVFFVQDTGGRQATLCFVLVLVLSFLGRYSWSRSNEAAPRDPSSESG